MKNPGPPPRTSRRRLEALARSLSEGDAGLMALAVAVGVAGAAGAVLLRYALAVCQLAAFGHTASPSEADVGLRLILAPAVGALLAGLMTRSMPEVRGHGVPELMRAVQLGGGKVRGLVSVLKTLASAVTIGSGGSCGREGPIAQIGAALGSQIGQRTGLPPMRLKVLTAAGAAAGIAATFNAPIAGAFFALEVVLGNFAMESFAPIVVASVVGTVLAQPFLGKAPAFALHGQIAHALEHPAELIVYALLGALAGLLAIAFTRSVVHSEELFEKTPLPTWLRPVLGGLAVGALGYLGLPEVMGNGEDVVTRLLNLQAAEMSYGLLLLLLVGKLVATSLTLGSGGSGGVFFPSLYLGAVLGAVTGQILSAWFPGVAHPGAYALVGMAAVAAGTTHAPITMVIMVFELTNDYLIIVPLLVATAVSGLVARGLHTHSIYTLKLARRGVSLHRGLEAMIMHDLRVRDVMRRHEAEVVDRSTPLAAVVQRFLTTHTEQVYVTGEAAYAGTILLHDVKAAIAQSAQAYQGLVIAADVVNEAVPALDPDAPLTVALEALHRCGLHEVPVVAPGESGAFLGTISEHDLLGAYNQEVLKKEVLLARFVSRQQAEASGVDGVAQTDYYELPPGHQLAQTPVPADWVGRTLAQLDLRRRLGLNVLAIKVRALEGQWVKLQPDPQRALLGDDLLIVMGPSAGVEALRSGQLGSEIGELPVVEESTQSPG